jgi:hypothetical protein
MISSLRSKGGEIKETQEDIEVELTNYFRNLLIEPDHHREIPIHRITRDIPKLVSPE